MKARAVKWVAAILASGALHAGGALYFADSENEVSIAGGGGAQIEIAILGNSLADAVSAGNEAVSVEPVPDPFEEMQRAEPERLQARADQRVEKAVAAIGKPPAAAVDARLAPQTPATKEATAAPPARPRDVQPPIATPAKPGQTVATAESDPARPTREEIVMETVPVPTPRPDYTPPKQVTAVRQPKKPAAQAPKPPARQETRKARSQASGSGGRNAADAKKGAADGAATARASASGKNGARNSQSGNAAISNYPGKVAVKLRRALRYPAAAKRSRLRGEVRVAFVISGSGGVTGIRVVRSSGSDL